MVRELLERRPPHLSLSIQHAHALQNLLPMIRPGGRVLDVGSGSGYLVAVIHHLVSSPSGTSGKVIGIDHIPELVKFSVENLRKDSLESALDDGRIVIIEGDGRQGTQSFNGPTQG